MRHNRTDETGPEDHSENNTNFGYQQVPFGEKQGLVAKVFNSVASRYDIMNDLMSFGVHRIWKKITTEIVNIKTGDVILDVAGGTGYKNKKFAKATGKTGKVILADINNSMLKLGRDKIIDSGFSNNVSYIQANAECLPFLANSFDHLCISFGLRNVTDKQRALNSFFRVLKNGGKLIILEFSKPSSEVIQKLYDNYSFNILPKIGKLVTGDEASYQYLAESIRMHPGQEKLLQMMQLAGFKANNFCNLTGGIVAIHTGVKG